MVTEDLKELLSNLKEKDVYNVVRKMIDDGKSPREILKECQSGMRIIGERYKNGEYFVADMMYAGEIMRNVMDILKPFMSASGEIEEIGTVVIGTVKGDIHDLGKDVVSITLQGNGFKVVDLGVDVPAEKFVKAIKENKPQIVGMSVFLTSCFPSVENIVKAINDAGLHEFIKIMIGGAPVTDYVAQQTGCDFYGKDAASALDFSLKVISNKL